MSIFILASAQFFKGKSDSELEILFKSLTEEEFLIILVNWPLFSKRVVRIAQKIFERTDNVNNFASTQKLVLEYRQNYEHEN